MLSSSRFAGLAYVALVSATAASITAGCATSAPADLLDESSETAGDAASDGARRDAAVPGTEPDAAAPLGDGGGPTGDASIQDGAAGDASTDGGDAGTDAGPDAADGGGDAGDAGDAGPLGTKPAQGEIVISEVMYNPSTAEPDTEWLELYNAAATPRLLSGLVLEDSNAHTHTLRPGLVIQPGAYVVLASKQASAIAAGKVPAAVVVYDYNTGAAAADVINLSNNMNGEIVLRDGVTPIARAQYGGLLMYSAPNGTSIQLMTLDFASAGVKASWCYSPSAWIVGSDKGTPGAAHDCP